DVWILRNLAGAFHIRDATTLESPLIIEASTPDNTLYLNSSGNVGIGTTNPLEKFDVAGGSGTGGILIRGSVSAFSNLNGLNAVMIDNDGSFGRFMSPNGVKFYVSAGGSNIQAMTILSGGNVGIATTSPAYALHVYGTGAFSQPVIVGTPTGVSHAATKSYVDSISAGSSGVWLLSGSDLYASSTAWEIGIGTTTPDSPLQISKSDTGVNTRILRLSNTGAAAVNSGTQISFTALRQVSGQTGVGSIGGIITDIGDTTFKGALVFYTAAGGAPTEHMRLSSSGGLSLGSSYVATNPGAGSLIASGNVGIGTTGPSNLLHIAGATTKGITLENTGVIAGDGSAITFNLNATSNNAVGKIQSLLVSASDSVVRRAGLGFFIKKTGTALGTLDEVMRIDEAGNVGIGTTTPAYALQVYGTGAFSQPIVVGTPTQTSHATTKSYVDSISAGSSGVWLLSGSNLYASSTSWNVGIGTTTNINSRLVVTGSAVASNAGYTANGVINGSYIFTSDSSPYGYAPLVGAGGPSHAIKVNPLGRAFGSVGVVGSAYDENGGGRNSYGVYGYTLFNAVGGNSADVKIGGLFLTEMTSAVTSYNSSAYGVYASTDTSSATSLGAASVYGVYGNAVGKTNSTVYGGYFSASGGTNNYGLIVSAGNVGIGTTSPTSLLHLRSDDPQLKLDDSGGGDVWILRNLAGAFHIRDATTLESPLIIEASTPDNTLYLNSSGNVGIGTTAPSGKLEILGSENADEARLIFSASDASDRFTIETDLDGSVPNDRLGFRSYSTDNILVLTNPGNVGIGTVSPGSKLQVSTGNSEYLPSTSGFSLRKNEEGYGLFSGVSGSGNAWLQAGTSNDATNYNLILQSRGGSVGIATSSPAYNLHVYGTGAFSQPVIVGTPTQTSHAATKNYVDSAVIGGTGVASTTYACNADATCEMSGANLNSGDITGVDKLTVTTIDPLYQIGASKYASYVASIVGGVKEEFVGRGKLSLVNNESGIKNYEYTIDFSKVNDGSDLWVWYKTIEFSKNSVEAIATPYGQAASIYYVINGKEITFKGDKPADFSFRLTGKRFDWKKWPTLATDQSERPSFIIK
ncbi:MAG: hypothetical protein V2A55_00750, partial [Candidatus Jorgensenbacteria bacterium]